MIDNVFMPIALKIVIPASIIPGTSWLSGNPGNTAVGDARLPPS
jgi:hypothetical protein